MPRASAQLLRTGLTAVPAQGGPATSTRGAHILIVAIGPQLATGGLAAQTLGIAEHLAGRSATITLFTGVGPRSDRRSGRRPGRSPRLELAEIAVGSLTRVHVDHLLPRRASSGVAGASPVSRTVLEANRLIAIATAHADRHPGPLPDLVLAVTPGLSGAVAGARLAQRCRVPLIVVAHDLLATVSRSLPRVQSAGDTSLVTPIEAHLLLNADAVALTDERLRAPTLAYGVPDDRIRLLPSWTRAHQSLLGRRQARRMLGWPEDGLIVVCCDLDGEQHLDTVLSAAGHLLLTPTPHAGSISSTGSCSPTPRPDIHVMVIGHHPAGRRPLWGRRTGAVRFVGPLDPLSAADAVAAADLLVISEPPGASLAGWAKLLDSHLSAGRAVIAAADRSGELARRIARSSGAGVVVAPGDAEHLAATIDRLGAHADLRAVMGRRAVQFTRNTLGHAAAMAVVDDLVNAALARNR
ncbi:MAG: hypothetical protein IPG94_18285 [Kineosporiaceae bacterium]|nr:hypothetical protein [Kineosporiaceae bacterium]